MSDWSRANLPVYEGGTSGKVIETITLYPLILAVVPHS